MKKTVVMAVIAALMLGACASSLPKVSEETAVQRYQSYAGAPVDRFTAFRVTGWTALTRDKLVLWTGVNEAWLLTVWNNCQDLQFAEGIRLKRTGASVTRSDMVIVGRDRCPISEIRPIDVKQMKADRAAERDRGTPPR
jgi:Family of unknown function (DUF6491)